MWVLPTYGRPDLCQRFLDSVIKHPGGPGHIIVDGDPDPAYTTLTLPPGWTIEFKDQNASFLFRLQGYFEEHPDEPWYGLLNDDFIIESDNWTERLVEAAGQLGMSNSNDDWRASTDHTYGATRICGALVFGGALVRTLGWWCVPGTKHCYTDDAWEEVGRRLGNWTTCMDIMVRHRHVNLGPEKGMAQDKTNILAVNRIDQDYSVWSKFQLKGEFDRAVMRVHEALKLQTDWKPTVQFLGHPSEEPTNQQVIELTPQLETPVFHDTRGPTP